MVINSELEGSGGRPAGGPGARCRSRPLPEPTGRPQDGGPGAGFENPLLSPGGGRSLGGSERGRIRHGTLACGLGSCIWRGHGTSGPGPGNSDLQLVQVKFAGEVDTVTLLDAAFYEPGSRWVLLFAVSD